MGWREPGRTGPGCRDRAQADVRVPAPSTAALDLHAGDELFHALVDGPERVLAQHGALRLVVQLEVHPVDGEVPSPLLRPPDEIAAQPGPRRLRWDRLGL